MTKPGRKITRNETTVPGRMGDLVRSANRWREAYNPLRGLTIARAVRLLEQGQLGDYADLQWTYRFIEQSNPVLLALLNRCESPLLTFDWNVKQIETLPPGVTEDQAKRQVETLKLAYEKIDNLRAAFKHLHLAEFRGFAHLQKHFDEAGDVVHLEVLDQWKLCRDGMHGDWFWNPSGQPCSSPAATLAQNRIGGPDLPREHFIIREVDRPINRIALINFIRRNLIEKDWDGFIEIYGIPGGVVVMPPNVPQGKESEYEESARRVAEGGSGALPNGSDYKPNDGPRGVDPFTPRRRALDEDLILAGTGGKLTMLAESGSGTLAGNAHESTFKEIAKGRAASISECFQQQFDKVLLAERHPGEPALAYFELEAPGEEDEEKLNFKREVFKQFMADGTVSDILANATKLIDLTRDVGLPVNEDYKDPWVPVTDEAGRTVTGEVQTDAEGDVIGAVPASAPALQGNLLNRARKIRNRADGDRVALLRAAIAADLSPLLSRLNAVLEINDDALRTQKLRDWLNEAEALKKDIAADPKAAGVFGALIAEAMREELDELEDK